jgi:hypothetical protein
MKLKVGQTVYLEPTGNAVRYSKDIIETKVTRVGRKYFEVQNNRCKFDIENMYDVSNCYSNYNVYLSMQEIEDKNEKIELNKFFSDLFAGYCDSGLSLEQLRAMKKVADEVKK